MDNINFTNFDYKSPLTKGDFLVGYRSSGSAEIKTTVEDVLNLVVYPSPQILNYNSSNFELTISNGNVISLESLSSSPITSNVNNLVISNSASWSEAYTNLVSNSAAYLSGVDLSFLSVSANWNSTYTTVGEVSASWSDAYTNLVSNSAAYLSGADLSFLSVSSNWDSTYTTVGENSASWSDAYTNLVSNSAAYLSGVDLSFLSVSSNWDSTYTNVSENSSYWSDAYTNLVSNSAAYLSGVDLSFLSVSANWDSTYTIVSENSASWSEAYTNLVSNSAAYLSGVDLSFLSVSSNWDSTYTNVSENSANWGSTYTIVSESSASWSDAYTNLVSNSAAYLSGVDLSFLGVSANWDNTYTVVSENSASWTTITSVTDYLSTNSVLISALNITSGLSANAFNNIDKFNDIAAVFNGSVIQGNETIAMSRTSHSEGDNTTASGECSHTEGFLTATGEKVPFATYTAATKIFTFTQNTSAKFNFVNEGTVLRVYGETFYIVVVLSRDNSTGDITIKDDVIGEDIADGYIVTNSGLYAHAEGDSTVASGQSSHAEGYGTIASGLASHSQGSETIASGDYSFSAGSLTFAKGNRSFTSGMQTSALKVTSHASGTFALADHSRSWVWQGNSLDGDIFSSTKSDQFAIRPINGFYLSGSMGINTDSTANALTVAGDISANGNITTNNSKNWDQAYNYISTYPLLTSFLVTEFNLKGATGSRIVFLNSVPTNRRFLIKSVGVVYTEVITNGAQTVPVVKIHNTGRDVFLFNNYAPSFPLSADRYDLISTSTNNAIVTAGEGVEVKLTTPALGFSTILADIVIDGYLI